LASSLSPHAAVASPPVMRGVAGALRISSSRSEISPYVDNACTTSLGFGPTALLLDLAAVHFPWPRLRRRDQLLHYLASGFPPHRIFHVFTEYDGIAGDLFHAAVKNLVVLTQEIRVFGAVGDYRHHFPGHVFDRAL